MNVLLSIREDAWAKLDRFEGHIPSLFANYLRVDHLDLEAAREAIEGPIEAWNRIAPATSEQPYEIEPALVEAVIAAAAGGRPDAHGRRPEAADSRSGRRPGRGAVPAARARPALARDRRSRRATRLTLARLEALGGARRIVENHLLDALGRLTPAEQDAACDCFRFLVSARQDEDRAPRRRPRRLDAADPRPRSRRCSTSSAAARAAASCAPSRRPRTKDAHELRALPRRPGRPDPRLAPHASTGSATAGVSCASAAPLLALVAVFAALSVWALVERHKADSAAQASSGSPSTRPQGNLPNVAIPGRFC